MEIFIIPDFEDKKWSYHFIFTEYSKELGLDEDIKKSDENIELKYSKTLQYCYNNAITKIALIGEKNNWLNKL